MGGGGGSGNPLNSDEHSNGPKTDAATGEHGLLPDEVAAIGGDVEAKGDSEDVTTLGRGSQLTG